jgi:type IV pilus assembly protein PilC
MKKFQYKVIDGESKTHAGLVEAVDKSQASEILRNRGYMVLRIDDERSDLLSDVTSYFRKPGLEDISNFTRQLSTMISAGLSIVNSLEILKKQSSPAMAKVIDKVSSEVEGGSNLGDSMEKAGGLFDKVYVALVRAGESAGVLDKILKKLADNLEKQREFRNKTRGAMIYPVIILIGMVIVTSIMMIFVIPKMTDMYKEFGAELPMMTKVLIGVSNAFVNFWPIMIIVVAGGVFGFRSWIKTEIGGLMYEEFLFKIPILGPLRQNMILTEFARTMGLLSASGISVLEALRIVAEALDSKIYREGVMQAAIRVEKGYSLADSLTVSTNFPAVLPQMVSVGEQTGKVDEILNRLAIFYEEETETKVKALTTAIEPLIMVVMGVGVGFLVFAVIMPIYNLTSQF